MLNGSYRCLIPDSKNGDTLPSKSLNVVLREATV